MAVGARPRPVRRPTTRVTRSRARPPRPRRSAPIRLQPWPWPVRWPDPPHATRLTARRSRRNGGVEGSRRDERTRHSRHRPPAHHDPGGSQAPRSRARRFRARSCSTACASRSRRRPAGTRRAGAGSSWTTPTSGPRSPRSTASAPIRISTATASCRDAPNPVLDSSQYLTEHLHEVPVFVIPCILGRLAGVAVERRSGRASTARSFPACGTSNSRCAAAGSARCSPRCTSRTSVKRASSSGSPTPSRRPRSSPSPTRSATDFKPAARRPIEEITYWNGWKQSS